MNARVLGRQRPLDQAEVFHSSRELGGSALADRKALAELAHRRLAARRGLDQK
jgi:hypothetical protein